MAHLASYLELRLLLEKIQAPTDEYDYTGREPLAELAVLKRELFSSRKSQVT